VDVGISQGAGTTKIYDLKDLFGFYPTVFIQTELNFTNSGTSHETQSITYYT